MINNLTGLRSFLSPVFLGSLSIAGLINLRNERRRGCRTKRRPKETKNKRTGLCEFFKSTSLFPLYISIKLQITRCFFLAVFPASEYKHTPIGGRKRLLHLIAAAPTLFWGRLVRQSPLLSIIFLVLCFKEVGTAADLLKTCGVKALALNYYF